MWLLMNQYRISGRQPVMHSIFIKGVRTEILLHLNIFQDEEVTIKQMQR